MWTRAALLLTIFRRDDAIEEYYADNCC